MHIKTEVDWDAIQILVTKDNSTVRINFEEIPSLIKEFQLWYGNNKDWYEGLDK